MRTLIKRVENFNSAETEWGARIRENVRNRFLEISTPNFEIRVSLSSLCVTFRIKRPNHEHDDFYRITVELDENGLVEEGSKGVLMIDSGLRRFLDFWLRHNYEHVAKLEI